MDIKQLKNILEAGLLVAGRAMSLAQLEALFQDDEDKPERKELREALEELQKDYEGRGIELVEVASGFRLQSHASVADWIGRLFPERAPRYSRALLETLVLIAYRQPITRAEIEDVRGVAVSSNIIKTLQEREWVKVFGYKDVPGRPALLGTTKEFLDYFNLKKLEDLPTLAELKDLDKFDALQDGEKSSEAEASDAEANDAEASDAEANDAEANDAEASDAEANDAEANDAEASDAEASDAEAKIEEDISPSAVESQTDEFEESEQVLERALDPSEDDSSSDKAKPENDASPAFTVEHQSETHSQNEEEKNSLNADDGNKPSLDEKEQLESSSSETSDDGETRETENATSSDEAAPAWANEPDNDRTVAEFPSGSETLH